MDDLRTDLKEYFDLAVKPVDIADIVETDYVIGLAQNGTEGRGGSWRWRGLAAGAVVALLVWGLIALTGGGPQQIGDPAGPVATTVPSVATTRPETTIERSLNLLDFRYTYPAGGSGWELFDGFRLHKSAAGPQGAEGIVYWVGYPNSKNAYNCVLAPEYSSTSLLDNLARGVARTPGLTLLSGPEDVLVGGQPARYISLEITADDGCDPGYFYNWRANDGGALWDKYSIGFIVDVWIVGAGDRMVPEMVIVGLTDPDYPALRDEIQEFVSSIVFPTE